MRSGPTGSHNRRGSAPATQVPLTSVTAALVASAVLFSPDHDSATAMILKARRKPELSDARAGSPPPPTRTRNLKPSGPHCAQPHFFKAGEHWTAVRIQSAPTLAFPIQHCDAAQRPGTAKSESESAVWSVLKIRVPLGARSLGGQSATDRHAGVAQDHGDVQYY